MVYNDILKSLEKYKQIQEIEQKPDSSISKEQFSFIKHQLDLLNDKIDKIQQENTSFKKLLQNQEEILRLLIANHLLTDINKKINETLDYKDNVLPKTNYYNGDMNTPEIYRTKYQCFYLELNTIKKYFQNGINKIGFFEVYIKEASQTNYKHTIYRYKRNLNIYKDNTSQYHIIYNNRELNNTNNNANQPEYNAGLYLIDYYKL